MRDLSSNTEEFDLSEVTECINSGKPFEYELQSPTVSSREFIKSIISEYLKCINKEKSYNLLCLCMEEVISNSVKANVKRAYFLANNLDINNPVDYATGMKHFKEKGIGNIKDKELVEKVNGLGMYVKLSFKLEHNCLIITARNNSVISKEEIERINKKLKLSLNQTPEEMFMNSIDTTEGAGLGIIMIKRILSQVSSVENCFSISATDTETITELQISKD